MEDRYIAAVDLGTSKTAFSVAKITGDDVRILYFKEKPSEGVRHGAVFNPTKAAIPVKEAIDEAEDELGIKINQVVAGLPRYCIKEECSTARIDRNDPDSCISSEEIREIREMALDTYSLDDNKKEEIYGAVVQSYGTDGYIQSTEDEIVGMTGEYLEGNFKVFVGDRKASSNMDTMMNKVGVAVARKYFAPDQSARAVLSSDDFYNGVALIELGAGVSSVTIYRNNVLKHYRSIPFGGRSVTWDIKNECGFREKLAENIKLAYGACMPEKLQSLSEKVIQLNNDDGTCEKLPVKYLSEIISARMREIFEALLYDIQESGYAGKLRNGIVLTGGGANLTNCANMLREMSGLNVRTGFPRIREFSLGGFKGLDSTASVSTIGMILKAKEDAFLNCVDPTGGSADLKDTVFEHHDEPKHQKSPREKSKPGLSWGKKIKDKVSDTVGGLYDEMK